MKIQCEVNYIDMENDSGRMISSVEVTCSKCGHSVRSYGTGERSVKRCLAMFREECPEDEANFYVSDEE